MYTNMELYPFELEKAFKEKEWVGKQLKNIIEKRKLTKKSISENTGITRPTLDKLLSGKLTNQTNFNKHLNKVLNYLQLSYYDIFNEKTIKAQILIESKGYSEDELSKMLDIPKNEIIKFENGEEVEEIYLKTLATFFGTSVRSLKNINYFPTQIVGEYDFILKKAKEKIGLLHDINNNQYMSAFWGYLGVELFPNKERWYRITEGTFYMLTYAKDWGRIKTQQKFLVIPCINNKLLFINQKYLTNLSYIDDDTLEMNMTSDFCSNSWPLVIHEMLEDFEEIYIGDKKTLIKDYKYLDELNISKKTLDVLKKYEKEKYNNNPKSNIFEENNIITITHKDGSAKQILLPQYYNVGQEILYTIEAFYNGMKDAYYFNERYAGKDDDVLDLYDFIEIEDAEGTIHQLNLNNIAMIEFPLLTIDKAMYEYEVEEYGKECEAFIGDIF